MSNRENKEKQNRSGARRDAPLDAERWNKTTRQIKHTQTHKKNEQQEQVERRTRRLRAFRSGFNGVFMSSFTRHWWPPPPPPLGFLSHDTHVLRSSGPASHSIRVPISTSSFLAMTGFRQSRETLTRQRQQNNAIHFQGDSADLVSFSTIFVMTFALVGDHNTFLPRSSLVGRFSVMESNNYLAFLGYNRYPVTSGTWRVTIDLYRVFPGFLSVDDVMTNEPAPVILACIFFFLFSPPVMETSLKRSTPPPGESHWLDSDLFSIFFRLFFLCVCCRTEFYRRFHGLFRSALISSSIFGRFSTSLERSTAPPVEPPNGVRGRRERKRARMEQRSDETEGIKRTDGQKGRQKKRLDVLVNAKKGGG